MLDIDIFYIICTILVQSLVLIFIFQSLFFGAVTGYKIESIVKIVPYLSYLVIILTSITVVIAGKLFKTAIKNRELEIQETNNRYIRELTEVLRGQRHDFNNHLHIIYSLIQKGKYSYVLKYLEDLIGEVKETNDLVSVDSHVIAALITSKLHMAKRRGVQLIYDIKGDIEGGRVKIVHLSRILANLLDNAIEAAQEAETACKDVKLQLYGDTRGIYINITNPGSINPPVSERLYQPGVSTKKGKNRGMGLYIVKNIVDIYNGRVQITSSEEKGVRVLVELPR